MPTYQELRQQDPDIYNAVAGEMQRQVEGVELIPSENYISAAEMDRLVNFILNAVKIRNDNAALQALHEEVKAFCRQFPVPGVSS